VASVHQQTIIFSQLSGNRKKPYQPKKVPERIPTTLKNFSQLSGNRKKPYQPEKVPERIPTTLKNFFFSANQPSQTVCTAH
jgi:hypothetical protein